MPTHLPLIGAITICYYATDMHSIPLTVRQLGIYPTPEHIIIKLKWYTETDKKTCHTFSTCTYIFTLDKQTLRSLSCAMKEYSTWFVYTEEKKIFSISYCCCILLSNYGLMLFKTVRLLLMDVVQNCSFIIDWCSKLFVYCWLMLF